ncbi:MAG: efflux RND transporter periplasmic adaptor subunit [Zoogloeaceae bacterium]|nr:efflux RND transporter periplasmic adaptor subunit [Zoogloeaceae bacterium]
MPSLPRLRTTALLLGTAATLILLTACSKGENAGAAAPGQQAPQVAVVEARAAAAAVTTELPGRTAAYQIAEIRPQVGGIIQERLFTEGAEVAAGDLLYRIDPATYEASLESARAALARAEANAETARVKAERYAELVKIKAISTQANDDAVAAHKQAQAEIASARAAVSVARIDLDRTRVSAPIAGRIGRSTVTAGALVTANQDTALAIVQQLDPIYVDLTQSGSELMQLRRAMQDGRIQRGGAGETPVRLVFEDGSEYAHEGRLAFSEVTVDPGTGTVTLRAVVPNPEQELLPGMYVRARIEQGVNENAIHLPHAAVQRDPRGNATVMVVKEDDTVESRTLTVARSTGESWVVTSGLEPGERVVVEGLQRIRPGAKVSVVSAAEAR